MQQARILVLYTGGTFGMTQKGNHPLSPNRWEDIVSHITPINKSVFKQIEFTFKSFDIPLDSSQISAIEWKIMAEIIKLNYMNHDGFIIIHGTDTMAYSASALSFMFQNLTKPIVFTGAQLPVTHSRTDASINLVNAIHLAGAKVFQIPVIPEVLICFNKVVLRGNRSTKKSTFDFMGFESPNYPQLGQFNQEIEINKEKILPTPKKNTHFKFTMCPDIITINLVPGMNFEWLKLVIKSNRTRGIVLRSFGSGNIPESSTFTKFLEEALHNEMLIVNITQCKEGRVEPNRYQTSLHNKNLPIINGNDMTVEAATTKLMWVLAHFSDEHRQELFSKSLAGEIST